MLGIAADSAWLQLKRLILHPPHTHKKNLLWVVDDARSVGGEAALEEPEAHRHHRQVGDDDELVVAALHRRHHG